MAWQHRPPRPPLLPLSTPAQGPLIVAERWALHALASAGVKVPRYARVAATLSLLFTLGHYYFWAPAEELGMTTDFAGAMRRNFAAVAGTVLGHK